MATEELVHKATADKDPSALHENFAAWLQHTTGYEVDLKTVQLAASLRMDFQKSDENQEDLKARREAAELRKKRIEELRATKDERAEAREKARAEKAAARVAEKEAKAKERAEKAEVRRAAAEAKKAEAAAAKADTPAKTSKAKDDGIVSSSSTVSAKKPVAKKTGTKTAASSTRRRAASTAGKTEAK